MSAIDVSSFPLLRVDQIPLAPSDLLRRALAGGEDLSASLRAKGGGGILPYLVKQIAAIRRTLAQREAEKKVQQMLAGTIPVPSTRHELEERLERLPAAPAGDSAPSQQSQSRSSSRGWSSSSRGDSRGSSRGGSRGSSRGEESGAGRTESRGGGGARRPSWSRPGGASGLPSDSSSTASTSFSQSRGGQTRPESSSSQASSTQSFSARRGGGDAGGSSSGRGSSSRDSGGGGSGLGSRPSSTAASSEGDGEHEADRCADQHHRARPPRMRAEGLGEAGEPDDDHHGEGQNEGQGFHHGSPVLSESDAVGAAWEGGIRGCDVA